jgi:hypothetical protein
MHTTSRKGGNISAEFDEEMHHVYRKRSVNGGHGRGSGITSDMRLSLTSDLINKQAALMNAKKDAEHYSSGTSLVIGGHWSVAIDKRPKGWETWGIPE